jgi:hypothetical protein
MLMTVYGVADLIAAGVLFFSDFGWLNWLKTILILALIFKGLPSLGA